MKKNLLCLFFIAALIAPKANAQTLHVVSDPASHYDYETHGLPLWGYVGYPTSYNNNIYVYFDTVENDLESNTDAHIFLAKYNGSNVYTFYKNPDKGKGFFYENPGNGTNAINEYKPVVFNGNLFLFYNDSTNAATLAIFDGTSIKLAVNPDNTRYGCEGFATVYNNKLYLWYVHDDLGGPRQLAYYDAASNSVKLVADPGNSRYGVQGDPFILNNKLYLKYAVASDGSWHLASYDEINWKIYDNPDASNQGYQGNGTGIIWNNIFYAQYHDVHGHNRLMKFDGTNTPTLIAEPGMDGSSSANNTGYGGLPIIYNNSLYFSYNNHEFSNSFIHNLQQNNLAKYDGSTITVFRNRDSTRYGIWNREVIYDNQLCFFYVDSPGVHRLAKFNGSSITLVQNPDTSKNGYWDMPIVFGNYLFYQYLAADGNYYLGYYDNNQMHLIPNPPSSPTATSEYEEWPPFIFNDLLFLQYANVQYGGFANLVYLNQSVLPVTFLNFDGELQGNAALLHWSTGTETNNKGFEVQKSMEGQSFTDVAFVSEHGNSSTINNYSYFDDQIKSGANYYRLKQIDLDGRFTYSSVIKLDYSTFAWAILGNPVENNSWIQVQLDRPANVSAQIISMNGSVIQTISKGNLSTGTYSIPLNMGNAAVGVYVVRLMVDNKSYTKKITR